MGQEVKRVKLSVWEILTNGAKFYKQHFRKLAPAAAVLSLFMALTSIMTFVLALGQNNNNSILLLFGLVLGPVVLLASLIFGTKVTIALYILINDQYVVYNKHPLNFLRAYEKTWGKFWITVGYMLLISLWILVPNIILMGREIPYLYLINTGLSAVVMAYYYFLLPMIAIEPKSSEYARQAVKLAKGNRIRLFALQVITVSVFGLLNNIFTNMFTSNPVMALVVGLLSAGIYFFTNTYACIIAVAAYRKVAHAGKKIK